MRFCLEESLVYAFPSRTWERGRNYGLDHTNDGAAVVLAWVAFTS